MLKETSKLQVKAKHEKEKNKGKRTTRKGEENIHDWCLEREASVLWADAPTASRTHERHGRGNRTEVYRGDIKIEGGDFEWLCVSMTSFMRMN